MPRIQTDLLCPPASKNATEVAGQATSRHKRSRHARLIGRRSEEIALRWLQNEFPECSGFRWVADESETPGWDIESRDAGGHLNAVEVKGTSGLAFANFELTANELLSSQKRGEHFMICLVANCLGSAPCIQLIRNPARLIEAEELVAMPLVWRVARQARGDREKPFPLSVRTPSSHQSLDAPLGGSSLTPHPKDEDRRQRGPSAVPQSQPSSGSDL